jgi:hypothetical protein
MRAVFVVLGLLALAGCATRAPLPVMPTIDDTIAMQAKLATINDVPGFYRTAAAQIMANCGGYFDQLVTIAQQNAQTSGQVSAATQALSAILGLAQAAPGPISVLGVVGPAVTGAIANAQAGAPGGDHPAEMNTLIATEMNAYLATIGNPPADAPSAWLAAYGLFRTCSPAGIEAAKQQALADAPNHLVVLGESAAAVQPRQNYSETIPAKPAPMTVPQVMVHTSPPPAVAVVAQAIPDAQIRKMRAEWRAIQRHGRNAAEHGPRALPDGPHLTIVDPPRTDALPLQAEGFRWVDPPRTDALPLARGGAMADHVPDVPMAVAPLPPPQPAETQSATPQPKPRWKF